MNPLLSALSAATKRSIYWFLLVAAVSLFGRLAPAHADFSTLGSVFPADTAQWGFSPQGIYVGYTAAGTMTIDACPVPTVFGGLQIGYGGSGSVSISDGGVLDSGGNSFIGEAPGSSGTVRLSGVNSRWTTEGALYVGANGTGTLSVSNGGTINGYDNLGQPFGANQVYIGYGAASAGTATVGGSGSDSSWAIGASLYVGYSGSGRLNVLSGGSVSVSADAYVGFNSGTASTIHFAGGTLTTQSLFAAPGQLAGTGTIVTNGLVSDCSLLFDATTQANGLSQTLTWGGCTVTLDMSDSGHVGALGAGWNGAGTLTIQGTTSVNSSAGYLGYRSGAAGSAAVTDSSLWTIYPGVLYVGNSGSGALSITNGGSVTLTGCGSPPCYIGYAPGSAGTVTVSGSRSLFSTSGDLYVGNSGSGSMTVCSGGLVGVGDACFIGSASGGTGTVTVGGTGAYSGGTLTAGTISIGDYGVGTLKILSGGSASATDCIFVGVNTGSSSSATVNFAGGILTGGALFADLSSQITGNNAVIAVLGLVSNYSITFDGLQGGTATLLPGILPPSIASLTVGGTDSTGHGYSAYCRYLGEGWGQGGAGTLSVVNGANINSLDGYFGFHAGSTGTMYVGGTRSGSTWSIGGHLYVGNSGTGAMNIDHGGTLNVQNDCYIGCAQGSRGSGTVSAATLKVGCSLGAAAPGSLYVGCAGTGTLEVGGSASVVVTDETYVGYGVAFPTLQGDYAYEAQGSFCEIYSGPNAGSSGEINFGPGGGTLTTRSLLAGPSQMAAADNAWLFTNGLVTDLTGTNTVVLTSNAGTSPGVNSTFQIIPIVTSSGGTVNVLLDLRSGSNNGVLGAGWAPGGTGSLLIGGGLSLDTRDGYFGFHLGSTGFGTVTGSSAWTIQGPLCVGYYGTGSLEITAGGSVTTSGYGAGWAPPPLGVAPTCCIGGGTGSSGSLTVGGGTGSACGGLLAVGASLYVGDSGCGTLTIHDGGTVSVPGCSSWYCDSVFVSTCSIGNSAGATGLITISGTGATFLSGHDLYVGNSGGGTFSASNGANATLGGSCYIGNYGSGSLSVSSGAIATGNSYYVGNYGSGTLGIDSGGTVTAGGSLSIGYGPGSAGTVTVSGSDSGGHPSTLSGVTTLYVGCAGSGTLGISGGGSVSCGGGSTYPVFVGYYAGARGSVTLDGAGSVWANNGPLYVGYAGAGTVTQTGGANTVAGTLSLASCASGTGTYSLNGGLLAVQGLQKGQGSATFNFGNATLRADAGFTSSVPMTLTGGTAGGSVFNTAGNTCTLTGAISGTGGFTKCDDPSSGKGTLTLTGNNTYTGLTVVDHGSLVVSGRYAYWPLVNGGGADLQAGRITITYILAGIRMALSSGKIHSSTALSNCGIAYDYNGSASTLQIAVMGDANRDGIVDSADYDICHANLYNSGTWAQGDFNYDGEVTPADLSIVSAHMGESLPSDGRYDLGMEPVGPSPAPEPGSAALLVGGLIGLVAYALRKRKK